MEEIREGKRESRPLLLKLGFALALSIAGYFASQFRPQPRRLPPPKSPSAVDDGSKESTAKSSALAVRGLKEELHILTSEEAFAKIISGASSVGREEEYLMPEFNKLVMNGFESKAEENTEESPVEKKFEIGEREEMEKEIAYFRNLVEALKEKERSLEIQMIEYQGLKEQVATLGELENRLKVNAMESKLLNLKIESLQTENQRLQAQASEYPKMVAELESAREEIKHLKKRLNFDGEQAKEKLAALHRRVVELLDQERKHLEVDVEAERKVKRLKELEDEVAQLRKVNSTLAEENRKFAELLESAKVAASSESDRREKEAREEASHLKEENEELRKEIEQLQTDRCADVEELVYLRWVNACLRYELRNYQAPPGKTVARDLSRCLSPESERRAKKLILEYANSNSDTNDKNISLFDFDTESCSSSQTSGEECSDTSVAASFSTKNSSPTKSKLVSKLKKLILGRDRNQSKADSMAGTPTSRDNSMRRASVSPCSYEGTNERRNSFESATSRISIENISANHVESYPSSHRHFKIAESQRPPRSSLDTHRVRKFELEVEENIAERCRSDLGTSHGHTRMISEGHLSDLSRNLEYEDGRVPEKTKLKKFADALKSSHGSVRVKRRMASIG